jgi:hypothetical protein
LKILHITLIISALFIVSCGETKEKDTVPEKKKTQVPEKKIIPSVVKKMPQTTTLKSGEKTTSVIGSVDNITLFFTGDHVAMGSPFKNILALDADGKIKWTYATGGDMDIKVSHSNGTILLKIGQKALLVYLNLKTGKVVKAPKDFAGEGTPFSYSGKACNFSEGTLGCTFDGSKTWEVKQKIASKISYFEKTLCFVGENRTILCQEKTTGKKSIELAVPVIATVKNPNALNFTFVYYQGALYVAHYDGTISITK